MEKMGLPPYWRISSRTERYTTLADAKRALIALHKSMDPEFHMEEKTENGHFSTHSRQLGALSADRMSFVYQEIEYFSCGYADKSRHYQIVEDWEDDDGLAGK
jgi:hypothetical protein